MFFIHREVIHPCYFLHGLTYRPLGPRDSHSATWNVKIQKGLGTIPEDEPSCFVSVLQTRDHGIQWNLIFLH